MPLGPEEKRAYREASRRAARAAGLCENGSHKAEPGKTRCREHQLAFNAALKAKRAAVKAEGFCLHCPDADREPVVAGMSLCRYHLDRQKEAVARHAARAGARERGGPVPEQ
jgi:hypothetical protein